MSGDQNELRTFAVDLHRRPGVAEACLVLQDRAGLDVNVLLAAAWLGARRRIILAAEDVARMDDHVRGWHQEVVVPLRAVRRRLRSGPHPAPSNATAGLRADLQMVEIGAELLELDELQVVAAGFPPCVPAVSATEAAAAGMLATIAHFAGRPADVEERSAVDTIATATGAPACGA